MAKLNEGQGSGLLEILDFIESSSISVGKSGAVHVDSFGCVGLGSVHDDYEMFKRLCLQHPSEGRSSFRRRWFSRFCLPRFCSALVDTTIRPCHPCIDYIPRTGHYPPLLRLPSMVLVASVDDSRRPQRILFRIIRAVGQDHRSVDSMLRTHPRRSLRQFPATSMSIPMKTLQPLQDRDLRKIHYGAILAQTHQPPDAR